MSKTAEQERWHQHLRDEGCCIQGEMSDGRNAIHHIKGRKANLKGVKGFGEWYVICLSYWHHQDGRNPSARHINKYRFELENGSEKDLFIESVKRYQEIYGKNPMEEFEYQQIIERA